MKNLKSITSKGKCGALIVVFLSAFCVELAAQNENPYFESLSHLLAVKSSLNNEIDGFDLKLNNLDYELFPNTSINNTYTISYRFLTVSIGFAPSGLGFNDDAEQKGKTSYSSFGTEIRNSHIVQSFDYFKTKGFFLRNTDDFIDGWTDNQPYIQYPDLSFTEYSGITLYKVDPNLSLASLTAANTRQLKSVFSFVPNLYYRYSIIDDQSAIAEGDTTQKSNNFDFSISPGFVNTFVFKENIYLSAGLFPGVGRAFSNVTTRTFDTSTKTKRNTWLYRSTLLVGFGFDNGRFYSGTQILATMIEQPSNDGLPEINERKLTAEIFLGYRFKPPSFIRKSFDALERVLPNK